MAFLLVAILLALPAPALATPPEPLTIEALMWMTGENSATGYWWTRPNELFMDGWGASEEFFIAADTIHGTKTLVGVDGTITINFQAKLTWQSETTGEAKGRWVIVSGTGAYEKLHGVGETYARLDLGCLGSDCPPNIYALYSGKAHFD